MQVQITSPGRNDDGPIEVGTVVEHPSCFRLVQLGLAIPADDECRDKLRELKWQGDLNESPAPSVENEPVKAKSRAPRTIRKA
jgi:hypothetical protein